MNYLFLYIFAVSELRESAQSKLYEPVYQPFSSRFLPGVAIIAPAYNEAPTIVDSVRSLLAVKYADKEIVVVNDGSTDDTFARLDDAYDLEPLEADYPLEIPAEPVRGIYRSAVTEELLVVDKENGGKSDALNAGVWITEQPLSCAIDADSIIDRDGLLQVVQPFLKNPHRTIASGGAIWAVNGCEIKNGVIQSYDLPSGLLGRVQVVEYLRAFYAGRLGLSRLKGLIVISGAFGVFRTDIVREIGGYRHDSVTEDLDLVLRLHRYTAEDDREYGVEFVAEPVVWTEVPETLGGLSRQRRRWYRGMLDALVTHRDMIGNRTYGRVGMFALPFYVFVEALGRLIEGLGYVVVPIAFVLGIVNLEFFVLYFAITTGIGVFLSWFIVFAVVGKFNRYERTRQILTLLANGVLENMGYRQWRTIVCWRGLIEYLRGDHSWGAMERSGFQNVTDNTDE
jgi:cellulose synthase/poly-beta-1,6-N-acetylglucosamine synthase-like glycosyltransferase